MLKRARETAGLSLYEAANAIGIRDTKTANAVQRLTNLEEGIESPPRSLLLKISKKYRKPLLFFYLSEPPLSGDRGEDFRTLPYDYSENDDFLLSVLLRNVVARHGLIKSAMVDEDEGEILSFVNSLRIEDDAETFVKQIIDIFGIDLNSFRREPNPESGFKYLRNKIEKKGICVLLIGDLGSYHSKINVTTFRGYSIADDMVPFIIINDNDSHRAWSFTIIHEVVHILLGQTGVSNAYSSVNIEKKCNDIASRILLPITELDELQIDDATAFDDAVSQISLFANERNISSSMVAYKLYLEGRIARVKWHVLANKYRELWIENRKRTSRLLRESNKGPSYYTIRKHRVGNALIDKVGRYLYSGGITTVKAGRVLGVKPTNIPAMLDAIHL